MKLLLVLIGALGILLGSCTPVTSTNLPGQKQASFPKKMRGKYELVYPSDLAALAGDEKSYVSLTSNGIIFHGEGETETTLGDSLYLTTIGKQYYLSIGESPVFNVFKVVPKGKDLELYMMASYEALSEDMLTKYFSSVKEEAGEPDENGEPGMTSYSVTIDDSKLDDYFKSDIPSKDPFVLKRSK